VLEVVKFDTSVYYFFKISLVKEIELNNSKPFNCKSLEISKRFSRLQYNPPFLLVDSFPDLHEALLNSSKQQWAV
jgi:hypothetical protein